MDDIRVVVGDDDPLRRTLVRAQGLAAGILVVAETDDPAELRRAIEEERPDVVLLRHLLGERSTARLIAEVASTTPTVVIDETGPAGALVALRANAIGVLDGRASTTAVFDAIRAAAAGGTTVDPDVLTVLVEQWRSLVAGGSVVGRVDLTAREEQILAAMVEGLATKAVARRLGIAVKTVENHKIRIFDKLGARTQANAVSIALRLGLVPTVRN